MKKITSISLILVIVLNSILFGIIYIGLKGILKNDFLNSLDYKIDTVPITKLTSDDINTNINITVLDNDEIKIGNEFFDIYKTEFENGTTIYYCISDKNEEYLEKALCNFLFSSTNAFSGKLVKILIKQINFTGFPVSICYNIIVPHYKKDSIESRFKLQEAVINILTPPPEQLFS